MQGSPGTDSFSIELWQVTDDLEDGDGVSVTYRMDGSLLDLQVLTKTQDRLITGHLLVNDAALIAHTEQALRSITSCFADASRLFGLDVSLRKTEVFH